MECAMFISFLFIIFLGFRGFNEIRKQKEEQIREELIKLNKDLEERKNILLQTNEDNSYEQDAKREAIRLLYDWNERKSDHELWCLIKGIKPDSIFYKYMGMVIPRPRNSGIYTIYHDASAKHKNGNYQKLVMENFKQLKKEYECMV